MTGPSELAMASNFERPSGFEGLSVTLPAADVETWWRVIDGTAIKITGSGGLHIDNLHLQPPYAFFLRLKHCKG